MSAIRVLHSYCLREMLSLARINVALTGPCFRQVNLVLLFKFNDISKPVYLLVNLNINILFFFVSHA